MISAEPNEIARHTLARDIEPRWHVRLPSGMITMTLDELDAAFQSGSIGEHTLVAREDEGYLRPLGVVAGLFEEEQRVAPNSPAPWTRSSEVSGVRPAAPARRDAAEPPAATGSFRIRSEHAAQPEPSHAREAFPEWESAPARWLRQSRALLSLLTERATTWFAARSLGQRCALGAVLVASLAAVCALGPAQSRPPAPMPSARLAAQPRSPLAHPDPVVAPQRSLQPPAAPSATASASARAPEPSATLDAPIAREVGRHGNAFSERRKAGRSEGSRRSSRMAKASKRRAGRD